MRAVGVLASVGHREQTDLVVLQLKVFICKKYSVRRSRSSKYKRGAKQTCKFFAIDGFTTRTVATGEIAALQHELGDDTVELGTLVPKSMLARGEFTEVLGRLWHYVVIELEDNAASGFVVDSDIELSRVSGGRACRKKHSQRRSTWWIVRNRDKSERQLDK